MNEAKKPDNVRAAKRGIWFFMRTVLIIVLFAALAWAAFSYAMNYSNLYILTTEGLQVRASSVLGEVQTEDLQEYFTPAFLLEDAELNGTVYDDYTIANFDYRVEVEGITVAPWASTARATVIDRMRSLTGDLSAEKKPDDADSSETYPPPEWEAGMYTVYFRRISGRWYIYKMQLIEAAPTEEPKPTPDMSLTPILAVTPTPSTSPSASLPATPSIPSTPDASDTAQTPEVEPGAE